MIGTRRFRSLYEEVRNSRMSSKFDKATQVAIISGPAIVVEMIVKAASVESKIPMDWHYFGGRGVVYALGDRAEARKALALHLPTSDL